MLPPKARTPMLLVLGALCSAMAAGAQTLDQTTVNFGNVPIQTTSAPLTIALTNTQTVPLTINSISASGDFSETTGCPIAPNTLAAGAGCRIMVTFTPSVLAKESGTLTVNDNASNSPQTAQLVGTGVQPVSVVLSSYNFGNQALNETSTGRTVTITNYQTTPLTIASIVVTGDFNTTSGCPISPATLAAKTSCTITVTFTPAALGALTGTITVTYNASNSPQTVQLAGNGIAAVVLSPPSSTFANQLVDTSSSPVVVTLRNNLTTPLTIGSIATSGSFSETSNCPLSPSTLAGSSSCTISVVFTPVAAGAASGTLTVTDNWSTSPQTAAITGTGVLPVNLSPASVSFPTQRVNTTSSAQTITLNNEQTAALTISGISVSGNFAESATTCPLSPNTLAGGSSCTISVTFSPTGLGAETGSLSVTDNASTSSQTTSLSGSGNLIGLGVINVTPLDPPWVFPGGQQQFTATGVFSSGPNQNITNLVNWTSSVPAVAEVNSTGLAQGLAAGESLIVASYGGASGRSAFNVEPPHVSSMQIVPANSSLPAGAYQSQSAIIYFNNATSTTTTNGVTWSSSAPSVASISPSGLVTALSAGTTTIQASLGTVTTTTGLTVTQPSCVAPPAGLTNWWTGDGNSVDIGGSNSGTLQNGATYGSGEVAQSFVFPGNGSSLLINSPVYSPTSGTLMFWFQSSGGGALTGGYAGAQNRAPGFLIDSTGNLDWGFGNLSAQSLGQVNPNQWYHAALTYSTSNSETTVSVYLNGVLADRTIADADAAWNPQVAFGAYLGAQQPSFVGSIDEIAVFNNALTALQIKQVYSAFSAGMCKPTLQTIALSPATPNVAPGLTLPFDAVGTYSNSTTHDVTTSATWSTGNASIATISPTGLLSAVATGSTSVSGALGSVQGSVSLNVAASLNSIQVTPATLSGPIGTNQPFTATGRFSDGSQQNLTPAVSWTSSVPGVATISSNGIATSLGAGQTTITAKAGSVSGSAVFTVNSATLVSISVSPASSSLASRTTQQLTATGTFSDGSTQNLTATANWSSSASAVATVGSSGTATAVGAGQTTITATLGSLSGSATVTVTTAVLTAIQLTPVDPSLIIGSSQQFSVQAIFSDGTSSSISSGLTWTSSNLSVAKMSGTSSGLAQSTGTGATRVTVSYSGLTDSTLLTVQDELVSIAISPATFTLATGQTQQFSATGSYLSGVTETLTRGINWSSGSPSVAGVSASGGLATALSPGQTIVGASVGDVTGSATLTVGAPNVIGQWTTLPNTMPINPIHDALLPNNQMLVIAGSGACPPTIAGCPQSPPYGPANGGGALLMDPYTGQVLSQFDTPFDMFCNGMTIQQDGTAFIAGGNLQYSPFMGLNQAATFDQTTNTFTELPDMAHGRWYPTVLTLADGTILTFSGLNETGGTNPAIEFYTPGSGWSQQYIAPFIPDLYPRLHLLPSGLVFYSSATPISKMFNPSTMTWNTNFAPTNFGGGRLYGSSVLLPLNPANNFDPQVFIMGGANPSTNTTELIDLGAATPAWRFGPNMSEPRIEMNSVILPSGNVLALGGSLNNEDTTTASLNADLYNPATNSFTSAGANAFPRLYHSVAMLLPDATVWVAGGNPANNVVEPHIEIYQPAYLFNSDGTLATRPTIASAPTSITYGSNFTITTPDAANIASVLLIRYPSVTHAFGMDQRMVLLSFTAGNGTLTATAPPNGNILPPGYYMLFLMNSSGVPSISSEVQVPIQASGSAAVQERTSRTLFSAKDSGISAPSRMTPPDGTHSPVNAVAGQPSASAEQVPAGLKGTWSGKFVSKQSNMHPFTMKVVIAPDAHGNLVGTSTLNSDCLKSANLQIAVEGSNIVLAGSDEVGNNITVRGTLDNAGMTLKSSYILDGSATGRCETDDGTGALAKQ